MELTPRLRLMNWLVSQGLTGLPENDLIRGFCERCRAEGLRVSRGWSSSTRCTRSSRAAAFAGTMPRPTRATSSNTARPTRARPRRTGGSSIFYHMLENGHEELPVDLADWRRRSIFKFIDDLAEKGHKHFVAFVHRFGEAGTMGADGLRLFLLGDPARRRLWRGRGWRRCAIWCRCWGWRSSRRRRPTSPGRWAGSISGATPPSRCCADGSRAASPSGSTRCCGFPICAARLRSARASIPARSSRSSTIMRRPRSTPSMMPAARC